MNIYVYMIDAFFLHYLQVKLRIIFKLFYERCLSNTVFFFTVMYLFDAALCEFLTPSWYKL
jgi:hypothetical protein